MPSLDSLNGLLTQAAALLDVAAEEIRDVPLEPTTENIRRIATVLTEIFEMQQRIYDLRPDLKPPFLNEPSMHPESNRALGRALVEAYRLDDEGQADAAVAVLESYQAAESSTHHREIAQSTIERLREKGRP
jgi:hypothetical protein